jgi:hypothetical protein
VGDPSYRDRLSAWCARGFAAFAPDARGSAWRWVEGKSSREVRRCLKRMVARQVFKLLERSIPVGVEVATLA